MSKDSLSSLDDFASHLRPGQILALDLDCEDFWNKSTIDLFLEKFALCESLERFTFPSALVLRQVFELLPSSLKHLELSHCENLIHVMDEFCDTLERLPLLETIYLNGNNLQDARVEKLCVVLAKKKNIKFLNIAGNSVSAKGQKILLSTLLDMDACPRLETLSTDPLCLESRHHLLTLLDLRKERAVFPLLEGSMEIIIHPSELTPGHFLSSHSSLSSPTMTLTEVRAKFIEVFKTDDSELAEKHPSRVPRLLNLLIEILEEVQNAEKYLEEYGKLQKDIFKSILSSTKNDGVQALTRNRDEQRRRFIASMKRSLELYCNISTRSKKDLQDEISRFRTLWASFQDASDAMRINFLQNIDPARQREVLLCNINSLNELFTCLSEKVDFRDKWDAQMASFVATFASPVYQPSPKSKFSFLLPGSHQYESFTDLLTDDEVASMLRHALFFLDILGSSDFIDNSLKLIAGPENLYLLRVYDQLTDAQERPLTQASVQSEYEELTKSIKDLKLSAVDLRARWERAEIQGDKNVASLKEEYVGHKIELQAALRDKSKKMHELRIRCEAYFPELLSDCLFPLAKDLPAGVESLSFEEFEIKKTDEKFDSQDREVLFATLGTENYALKKASSGVHGREAFLTEVKMLSNLKLTFVIPLMAVAMDGPNSYYLVFPRYDHDLQAFISLKNPEVSLKLLIAKKILCAIAYLSTKGVIHVDVKPANVFLSEDGKKDVVLGDFDGAQDIQRGSFQIDSRTVLGSETFAAPEALEIMKRTLRSANAAKENLHFPLDVFSFGALLHWMLTYPEKIEGPYAKASLEKILLGLKSPPLSPNQKDQVKDLLEKLLHKNPKKRPTALEVLLLPLFETFSIYDGDFDRSDIENSQIFPCMNEFPLAKEPVCELFEQTFVSLPPKNLHPGCKSFEVIGVERLDNPRLWRKYVASRKNVAAELSERGHSALDAKKVCTFKGGQKLYALLEVKTKEGEFLLFHGLKESSLASVCSEGLDCRVSLEGSYGRGIYFADQCSHADQYVDDGLKAENFVLIVSRVLLGRPYQVSDPLPNLTRPPCANLSCPTAKYECRDPCKCLDETRRPYERFHSVFATKKSTSQELPCFNEFVLYENSMCYPELIVKYKRFF